jgi:hypothetical protein
MNVAPLPLPTCSVCQNVLAPNGTCSRCRAPEDWGDQVEALDFVVGRLKEWQKKGNLNDRQLQALTDAYAKRRQTMTATSSAGQSFQPDATFVRGDECWSCKEHMQSGAPHCNECGAPMAGPDVRALRFLRYLDGELRKHEESGLLTLRQSHEFVSDTEERIAALSRKLERERAPMVLPVEEEPRRGRNRRKQTAAEGESAVDETPRRSVLELLLDPRSIQWLLGGGGALTVLGLVIWLASIGVFGNPVFVAVGLGLGNAILLGGGWALLTRTRYQVAGRSLTLLACLVMPLNLWFYHTNDLVRLEQHLWVAALACCAVYATSAWVLKDSLFVYVLVGGVTLTGLLLLAEQNKFMEIAAPATFLIVLGLICLHSERAFPAIDSPFSRRNFGMAFFWSAQGLLGAGLLLLLGAQIIGSLPIEVLPHVWLKTTPDVATRPFLPWTLGLVLAGVYAYLYADLVVRQIGVYLYFAAISLLWAEILVLVLLNVTSTETIIIITLAVTALAINVLQVAFRAQREFLRRASPLGILLSLIPVLFGVVLHFRATNSALHRSWPFDIEWGYVIAMGITAICCRAGAYLYRHAVVEVAVTYFFATAAATLVFAAGLAWKLGLQPWETQAPLLMLIPILYLTASYFYRGHTPERPLVWAAHGASAVMLVCSLYAALRITPQVVEAIQGDRLNLLLAVYCLEASIFYGVAAFLRRRNWSIYLCAIMLCGAIWQGLIYFHTPDEYYTLAFALTGFALLIVYRLGLFEKWEMTSLEQATFQSANALTTLGFVSGALLSVSRYFLNHDRLALLDKPEGGGDWQNPIRMLSYLLVFLTVISLLSAWLVQHTVWRRVYLVLSIVNGFVVVLMIHKVSNLNLGQQLELFTLVVGLILLGVGYVGWYRETEKASDLTSFALFLGAACLVVPMLLAIVIYRSTHNYQPGRDDIGLVAACVLLFGSGILCRIKATTLIGSVGMLCYLVVIVIGLFRHLDEAWIIGISLTLGGAALFGTGLFLSMYRDRLLALPDKIKRREGIFRIFGWR